MKNREYFFFSFCGPETRNVISMYECFYYGGKDLEMYAIPVLDLKTFKRRPGESKKIIDPRAQAISRNRSWLSVHVGADPAEYEGKVKHQRPWDVFFEWCTFEDIMGHMGLSPKYRQEAETLILQAIKLGKIELKDTFLLIGAFPNLLNNESIRDKLIKTLYDVWYASDRETTERAENLLRRLIPDRSNNRKIIPEEVLMNSKKAYELMRKLAKHLKDYCQGYGCTDPEQLKVLIEKEEPKDPRLAQLEPNELLALMQDTPEHFAKDHLTRRLHIDYRTLSKTYKPTA